MRHYLTDDDIVMLEADIFNLRQESIRQEEIAQKLWTTTSNSGLVYDEKSFKALFVKRATHLDLQNSP